MGTYFYKAKKSNAETVTGQINAHSEEEALDLINQLGFLPVSVSEEVPRNNNLLRKKGRVKSKERYVFSRQLANLLKSGVSVLKALQIIEDQMHNTYFKKVINQIAWGIKNGRSLSECLSDYPHIFSELYITMVHAGEESSNMQHMLVHISNYQKRQEEIISKIKTTMTYPIIMGVVGMATVYFILTFVLPRMSGLFDNMGNTLPLPTLILLGISDILHESGFLVLGFFVAIVLGFRVIGYSSFGKLFSGRFTLKMPLFGEIILKSELARFSRALVLLQSNGVSILRALDIAVPILGNELIKKDLSKCRDVLSSGGSFGESLQGASTVPEMMVHMLSVGEESGHLNEVLDEISDNYEQEVDERIKVSTTLLEPVMILAIGLVVGFIVFAMLLPIFQMDVFSGV